MQSFILSTPSGADGCSFKASEAVSHQTFQRHYLPKLWGVQVNGVLALRPSSQRDQYATSKLFHSGLKEMLPKMRKAE